MTKKKITIGIPAYNEEANIGHLLHALIVQKSKNANISKIIVVSDCSSDKTNKIVRDLKDRRIKLISNKKRLGQAECQNIIIKKANTDILLLLNADVLPKSHNFIENITMPIIKDGADLAAARVKPILPSTVMENILYTSYEFKNNIFEEFKNGNNLYTCNGKARAFSKRFYKKLKFKHSPQEDAYSYLFCVKNGYNYIYVNNAIVFYALPKNWNDHAGQSLRFLKNKSYLNSLFGEVFVAANYKLPTLLFVKSIKNRFIKNPLMSILYVFVFSIMKILTFFVPEDGNIWHTSKSTKSIV